MAWIYVIYPKTKSLGRLMQLFPKATMISNSKICNKLPRSTFYKHSLYELKKLNLLTNKLFGLEFINFDYNLNERQPSLNRHPQAAVSEEKDFIIMKVKKDEER